jgi:phosphatidylglycerol:prolipoprotein diacylglycerol transferase
MHPHLARIGPVTIPTFGAVAALGLVMAIVLAARGARTLRINEDVMWNLCLVSAAGTLLLSRLIIIAQVGKAFLHYPLYILTLPTVTRYGLMAALLSGAAYALVHRMPMLLTVDAIAPAILLLQGALHIGTLFSGDDVGSVTAAWPGRIVPGAIGFHPVALYAGVLCLAACGLTWWYLSRESQPGETFGLALVLSALVRFFVDQFRPAFALPETTVANMLRIDQLALIALAVAGLCFFFQRRPHHAQ